MEVFSSSQVHDASTAAQLFDVYVQYKKDTRAITSWLLDNNSNRDACPENLSVRDLVAIAEGICAKAVAMPDIIGFHFRQAIKARNHLSKIFRRVSKDSSKSTSTENHEFFTSSLTKIYTDLCKCCAKPKDSCIHRSCQDDCTSQGGTCSNRFEALQADRNENESLLPSSGAASRFEPTEENSSPSDLALDQVPSTLVDDGLCNAFMLYQQIHEIHGIFGEVKALWQKAGQGTSNLLSATATTNVAYKLLEDVGHLLTSSCRITDPADLLYSYKNLRDSLKFSEANNTASACSPLDTTSDLDHCWKAMLDLRCAATKDDSAEQPRKPQLPPQIRLREGPGTTDSDNQCRSVLLSNIAQCVNGSHLRNSFIRWGSPLIREVNMFMSDEKTPSHCLHAASGLSLLLCSCKAYCFALPAGQSPAKCRVQALRFAQDAVAQISLVLDDSTMPCRCIGTLASHLENLKRELEEYLRSKMFDLFFQSPWVCGGHVLEMMHALRYYGLRLVAYRSYVGSVAHMYNVLRQIHGLDPIPVLEAMCEHLEDLFFPGGQPKKNFRACYVRYLGGRLRFHGKARHQNGCHALAIPAHTAKATAGLSSGSTPEADPRFDCGRFSLLHRLRDSGYRFDEASILPVAHFRKTSSSSSSNTPTGTATASNLQALHQALDAELTSPSFPNATFNFLSIYLICARIVDRISDAYHDPDAKKGQYCLCCAEGLVMAADGFREGKGWRVRKEIRELARVCTEVMKEELGGKKVDEFVWINL